MHLPPHAIRPDYAGGSVLNLAATLGATLEARLFPALQRVPAKAIPNLSDRPLAGLTFQQWSRHRTPQNPWRVGIDDLGTHLVLVGDWLVKELTR